MADDETPPTETPETPPDPPEEKPKRKRVSGADILSAIEGLGEKITDAIPGGEPEGDSESEAESPLPPVVTFAPEEEPTPTPIATDEEANAPVPPVTTPGKRKGFPHRGRRGRG